MTELKNCYVFSTDEILLRDVVSKVVVKGVPPQITGLIFDGKAQDGLCYRVGMLLISEPL